MCALLIALVLIVAATRVTAQLFTCSDNVTVCLVGVEICCCAPLVPCACCEPVQVCTNGTCATPSPSASGAPSLSASAASTQSASGTRSPSASAASATHSPSASALPSPSAPVACTQLDATSVTCAQPLAAGRVVLEPGVTTVLGDLEISVDTVLAVSAPISVQGGTAVVNGVVELGAGAFGNTTVRDGDFVPVITADQLVVGADAGISVIELPDAERECAQVRADRAEQRGGNFGVVFSVSEAGCDDGSSRDDSWLYTTLVPALAVGCTVCMCVCTVFVTVTAGLVFWRRVRGMLWARDSDLSRDDVVNARGSR